MKLSTRCIILTSTDKNVQHGIVPMSWRWRLHRKGHLQGAIGKTFVPGKTISFSRWPDWLCSLYAYQHTSCSANKLTQWSWKGPKAETHRHHFRYVPVAGVLLANCSLTNNKIEASTKEHAANTSGLLSEPLL